MIRLCRRSESQPFAGAVIESVFDHLNFLIRYACHLTLLRHVSPQQAIEILVGASLPTGKGPDKVAGAAQHFINRGVPSEFFAVVICQRVDPGFKRLVSFDDSRATKSNVLSETLAMTAYPLLRSTSVTMACLWAAPMTVSHSQ